MSQATTSQFIVSLRPPRPLTSFVTPTACQETVLTGCTRTPICSVSPSTLTGTAITFDPNGIPYLLCTTTGLVSTTSVSISGRSSSTSTASGSVEYSKTSPQSTSSNTLVGTNTGVPTTSASAAPSSSNSVAMHNASLCAALPGFMLFLWLGTLALS